MKVEFTFFTKEEDFKEFYGKDYYLQKNKGGPILGTYQQNVRNFFFFKYLKMVIALNLEALFNYAKNGHKLITLISKTIEHEFIHKCLADLEIKPEQQHWATGKLGLNID